MFGIIPIQFRFRGQVRRLFEMYLCFLDNDGKALHPAQLARMTGISLADVTIRLAETPELFVKLPKRPDGLTRYRITTAASTMSTEDVEALLLRGARRESFILYAFGTMIAALFLIIIIIISPIFQ